MDNEQIARVAHEVNRAYCKALGDDSQEVWELAPQWQRDSAIVGVKFTPKTRRKARKEPINHGPNKRFLKVGFGDQSKTRKKNSILAWSHSASFQENNRPRILYSWLWSWPWPFHHPEVPDV